MDNVIDSVGLAAATMVSFPLALWAARMCLSGLLRALHASESSRR